mmetsp:Transcript_856/g.3591  ORF Transcript_856/g.3591 Transcript_856/m.3591 type:complete len:227 (-) Transcript_856:333-1013(-)
MVPRHRCHRLTQSLDEHDFFWIAHEIGLVRVRNHAFRRRGHRVRRERQTLDDILIILLVHALRDVGTASDDVSQSIARRATKFIARQEHPARLDQTAPHDWRQRRPLAVHRSRPERRIHRRGVPFRHLAIRRRGRLGVMLLHQRVNRRQNRPHRARQPAQQLSHLPTYHVLVIHRHVLRDVPYDVHPHLRPLRLVPRRHAHQIRHQPRPQTRALLPHRLRHERRRL